jgi:hypothetical protein
MTARAVPVLLIIPFSSFDSGCEPRMSPHNPWELAFDCRVIRPVISNRLLVLGSFLGLFPTNERSRSETTKPHPAKPFRLRLAGNDRGI